MSQIEGVESFLTAYAIEAANAGEVLVQGEFWSLEGGQICKCILTSLAIRDSSVLTMFLAHEPRTTRAPLSTVMLDTAAKSLGITGIDALDIIEGWDSGAYADIGPDQPEMVHMGKRVRDAYFERMRLLTAPGEATVSA